jgi:hypothetical protein
MLDFQQGALLRGKRCVMRQRLDFRHYSATKFYIGCFLLAMSVSGLSCLAFIAGGRLMSSEPALARADRARTALYDPISGQRLAAKPVMKRSAPKPVEAPVVIARVDDAAALEATGGPAAGRSALDLGIEPLIENGNDIDETALSEPWKPKSQTFRTVCVRLCDGAYTPVSFATTRDRLKADSIRCEQGCGTAARLFVVRPDRTTEEMLDLQGRRYAELPNAFLYRTAFDAGCTCRRAPNQAQTVAAAPAVPAVEDVRSAVASVVTAPTRSGDNSPQGATSVNTLRSANRSADPLGPASDTVSLLGGFTRFSVVPAQDAEKPAVGTAAASLPRNGIKPADGEKRLAKATRAKLKIARAAKASVLAQAPERKPKAGLKILASSTDSGTQRPFKSSAYWRLSYWEPTY